MQAEIVVTCLLFSTMPLSYDLEMEMFISIKLHRKDHCLHSSDQIMASEYLFKAFSVITTTNASFGVFIDY